MKVKQITLLVCLGMFFLSGCAAVPLGLQTLGGAAITGYCVKSRVGAMDAMKTIEFPLEEVWRAAIDTAAEMNIPIVEKDLGKGTIRGRTAKHRVVEVTMESVTPTITRFGVRTRKDKAISYVGGGFDREFSKVVLSKIAEKCRTGFVVEKPLIKKRRFLLITIKRSNIRNAPGKHGKVIFIVPRGTKVYKVSRSGDWFKVQLLPSGEIGYIYNTLAKPATLTPKTGI